MEVPGAVCSALDSKVLVLNRVYAAIRVVDARRAFTLLVKQAAEVIALEDGQYVNYDFESWSEVATFQQEYEAEHHDWVHTARLVGGASALAG
ncbi:MAG: hypothetical protein KDA22_00095, partial [Phycisphaerales bacterium]|nr:hypothetical protein [Phycisphaerales bacterium]